ncbi:MAG: DUF4386 domain-containing protein [Bacteroidota bacterium]
MNNQKLGRLVGILFLLVFILGFFGSQYRGLSISSLSAPDFLEKITSQALWMKTAIFSDLAATLLGVIIASLLYPLVGTWSKYLARIYFGLWLVQLALATVGNVGQFILIEVAERYLTVDTSQNTHLESLAFLLIEIYYFAHWMTLLFFCVSGAVLYAFLIKSNLVPRLIALWGLLAVVLVFTATVLQIFNVEVSFFFYLQNGIFLLVFAIWLIIKGFK